MADQARVLIVEARFYEEYADHLKKGAIQVLEKAGVAYDVLDVPGVFEIPAAIQFAVRAMNHGNSPHYDGFVALGCVIRGETTHYDYVCVESARALMNLSVSPGIALGYGIVTVENDEQAEARARVDRKDKGGVAALACLRMMQVKKSFGLAG
ncbi:MAG: 6,7-dimethyl-8-ribityllumazine synthase [Magnetospirillum sp. WYHS-4]